MSATVEVVPPPAAEMTKAAAMKEITALHSGISQLAQETLVRAIRIGELLAAQKAKLPHGRWHEFVTELPFTDRTASNYMRAFQRFGANRKALSDLRLCDVYELMREPKEKPKPSPAPDLEPEPEPEEKPRVVAGPMPEPGGLISPPVMPAEHAPEDDRTEAVRALLWWWKRAKKWEREEFCETVNISQYINS